MKQLVIYLLKIWVTTAVLSPLLLLIFGYLIEKDSTAFSSTSFGVMLFAIIVGALCSAPSFFLLYTISLLLMFRAIKTYIIKITLTITSFILVYTSFIIVLPNASGRIQLTIMYSVVMFVTIWLYKFNYD
ncbi:hypothetical protein [Mucilaginibacter sp.]|uniref:hypothetical protein n=1 Tax=Mucilaginibacter sp. TaxID=1882438 RepID=UPI0025F0B999|nr:hypothetical protein [Mucilaginibacter sp.]